MELELTSIILLNVVIITGPLSLWRYSARL